MRNFRQGGIAMRWWLPFCVLLSVLLPPALLWAEPATPQAIEGYLSQLKTKIEKPAPGEFQFATGFKGEKSEKFLVRVMPQFKLVYVAVLEVHRLGVVDNEAAFRKLAELNFNLSVGKLEWDAKTGEVRLSFTFANENGVDEKSFFAVIQTLLMEVGPVREALRAAKSL